MKFAVVGAGVIGDLHAQTITNLSGAEVSVVDDVQFERAQDLAGRHGARPLSDISAALSLPDIDAVAICTPSGDHADLAVAALKAGKHVVVEKPLDVWLAAAGRVAAAERESGRRAGFGVPVAPVPIPPYTPVMSTGISVAGVASQRSALNLPLHVAPFTLPLAGRSTLQA